LLRTLYDREFSLEIIAQRNSLRRRLDAADGVDQAWIMFIH
jgi:hypothetical protein